MKRLDFWKADGADASLAEALGHVTGKKAISLKARLAVLIESKLAQEPMAPATWQREGGPPQNAGDYYAIKKIPVRRYCRVLDGTLCISHYTYKNWQKLDAADDKRVATNWRARRRKLDQPGGLT